MSRVTAEDEFEVGSIRAVKNLYNHSSSRRPTWSEIQDRALEERRIKSLGQSHFIIRRFSRHTTESGEDAWAVHSIELKSGLLRAKFDEIFKDYPSWYPDDTPYTLFPPYKPLVHRWDALTLCYESEKNRDLKMELHILRKELEPLISVYLSALQEVKRTAVLNFDQLWLVLAPGEFVLSHVQDNICLSKVVSVKRVDPDDDDYDGEPLDKNKPYWELFLGQIDWNGRCSGLSITRAKLRMFDGSQIIQRLEYYPIGFLPDHLKTRERLLKRGGKFETLRGFHVRSCVGKKFIQRPVPPHGELKELTEPINGRYIVDAYAFYACQQRVPKKLLGSLLEYGRSKPDDDEAESENESDDSDGEEELAADDERRDDLTSLSDEECMIAVPRVKGFDLQSKEWCEVNVDDLEIPEWDDNPYENLIIRDGHKALLIAFTDHQARKTGFDDFVKHKGEGVVVLLCGPPGVGKTLTAEAVAEKSRVPLYMLSAGDLGSKPEELESALRKALKCCQLWGAVLLLDEADVFLESRSSESLKRNELVSIFLRQLEYYQGVLFLTTNRTSTIDPAFKSRIDLILPYYDLKEEDRKSIWQKFIVRLSPDDVELSEGELDMLSKEKLNGREIKNLIKTALILAAKDKPLRMEHIETVLEVRREVDKMGVLGW